MDQLSKFFRIEATAADVHSDAGRYGATFPVAVDESFEKVGGQVVDDVPTHVLEGVEYR